MLGLKADKTRERHPGPPNVSECLAVDERKFPVYEHGSFGRQSYLHILPRFIASVVGKPTTVVAAASWLCGEPISLSPMMRILSAFWKRMRVSAVVGAEAFI